MSPQEKQEKLNKSIDSLLTDIFGEPLEKGTPETIAIAEKKPAHGKSIGDDQKPDLEADENGAKKEGEEDEVAGKKRGRPDDLSQVSMREKDGASKGKYDASITSPAKKVPDETTVAKSIEISPEDYELLVKAKAEKEQKAKDEELRKSREVNETLVKAAVAEATKAMREENETLRKSLDETNQLIKSIAKKPQPRKSVSTVSALEKSFGAEGGAAPTGERNEAFSKSEMLDTAEALVKSGKLTVNQVIELEDTGYIYDAAARRVLEQELQKRK